MVLNEVWWAFMSQQFIVHLIMAETSRKEF